MRRSWGLVISSVPLCFAAALAADGVTSDVGTLDKAAAERAMPKPPYSPYAGRNYPVRPFFGDTHLHTGYSMDAGAFGARLGPRDAYRLARGEEITASSGQLVRLSRPLDFLVVADHSDNMGFFPDLFAGKPSILADATGRKWYEMIQAGKGADAARSRSSWPSRRVPAGDGRGGRSGVDVLASRVAGDPA